MFHLTVGMIEPGENGLAASKREFYEEVFNTEEADESEKEELKKSFATLFAVPTTEVYKGYVDDPRNTDNAWMETQAIHFHAGTEELQKFLSTVTFKAGSDARNAGWLDISSSLALYASHKDFIRTITELKDWDW